ncbi:MAG: hypothetical protein GY786_23135, partial [Proteobacteria bacterium]|nr:hypothetical protein [Pseudomonadota bacterium]
MNVLISFLTVYHLTKILEVRYALSVPSRVLLLLGTLLPLADSVFRFFVGEYRFQNEEWFFHSLIYQGFLWSGFTLLFWVYCRSIRYSVRLLLPLVGLLFYTIFALMGAHEIPLFTPITNYRVHLGGLYIGYWVPVVICLTLLILQYWLKLPSFRINLTGLTVVLFFLLSTTVILSTVDKALPDTFRESEKVNLFPGNFSQTLWSVVALNRTQYTHANYHLLGGWQEKRRSFHFFKDVNLAQKVLEDPSIKNLYFYSFYHPTLNVTVENELLRIEMTETSSLPDLIWIKQILMSKSISGELL